MLPAPKFGGSPRSLAGCVTAKTKTHLARLQQRENQCENLKELRGMQISICPPNFEARIHLVASEFHLLELRASFNSTKQLGFSPYNSVSLSMLWAFRAWDITSSSSSHSIPFFFLSWSCCFCKYYGSLSSLTEARVEENSESQKLSVSEVWELRLSRSSSSSWLSIFDQKDMI